jgi:hypothetical protein
MTMTDYFLYLESVWTDPGLEVKAHEVKGTGQHVVAAAQVLNVTLVNRPTCVQAKI